jgi:hypothetical protein
MPYDPNHLERTLAVDRSRYLDRRINAALGLCPEPRHPLEPKPQRKITGGASHAHKLGVFTRRDAIRKMSHEVQ